MSVDQYLSAEKIQARVKEVAAEINKDFHGKQVHIVGVLNGAFMFTADLVRHLNIPVTLEFMSASSYGDSTVSSGDLKINLDIKTDIKDKHVILVEDIVDTGLTISVLKKKFLERAPASLSVASFLFKPARLENEVKIDYLAFEIEDHFVIGYGLDFAGRYRELPYVGIYKGEV
ncbi:MAG: hypoxanthine phosphoribosyltransferase [Halobacteriovoraceae bacterium]|nr:hypoxanthine phosphoribosyltransferase [Halobacteriovoraceae bacterium]